MLFGLENVTYTRATRRVFSDLNVAIADGRTALVGPSGAGKSRMPRQRPCAAALRPERHGRERPHPPTRPMSAASRLSLGQVAAPRGRGAIAAALSIWQHADLQRDIAVASFRRFIHLTAGGYVIK